MGSNKRMDDLRKQNARRTTITGKPMEAPIFTEEQLEFRRTVDDFGFPMHHICSITLFSSRSIALFRTPGFHFRELPGKVSYFRGRTDTMASRDAAAISPDFIKKVCDRLFRGEVVRQILPEGGRLHIDRPLPFLCVYRKPPHMPDAGTERLVKGEASYLITSGSRSQQKASANLVLGIARTQAAAFGAFLIVEIWAAPERSAENEIERWAASPGFRIFTSRYRPPTGTVESLEKYLKLIRIQKRKPEVEITYEQVRSPAGMPALITRRNALGIHCHLIGLEVRAVYRNAGTGELFPLLLRKLHRGVARALKRSLFEFSRGHTSLRLPSYQAMGRHAVVKAVWEVDRELAGIDQSFDFLLLVTPVNSDSAWIRFKQTFFDRVPKLYYRPLHIDPTLLKRNLFRIHIERVEDPTLEYLFEQKRGELDRMLTMLGERSTPRFLYGSLQLFGGIDAALVRVAETLLATVGPRSHDEIARNSICAHEFAELAKKEVAYYQEGWPALSSRVEVREDITGLMVSKGNLLIGKKTRIPLSRTDALIQHEVGTHIVTYFNGIAQPFRQLYCGLAGYDELQEGLAVLAEYLVGGMSRPRLRLLAGRVMAAKALVDGASFVDTFRMLNKEYGFEKRTGFSITVRAYRAGGLTKDAVYLRGLVHLLAYLARGGELAPLFSGKIGADHVPVIRELQARKVLVPVPLRPRYMEYPEVPGKIERIKKGLSVLDLIERKKNENRIFRQRCPDRISGLYHHATGHVRRKQGA